MLFRNGSIFNCTDKKKAIALASKQNGIKLYIMSYFNEVYLFTFYCGLAKKLKSIGFDLDNYYYVKPENSTSSGLFDYSIQADLFHKLRKFKNPKAIKEVKQYVVKASKDDDDEGLEEVYYVVIEQQGMLMSYEPLKGFTKIPCKALYKKLNSANSFSNIVSKIQKITPIDNLKELEELIKVCFGTSVNVKTEENEPEENNPKVEYTTEFLKEQYDLFNSKYFNNKLPNIPLRWRKLKRLLGGFKFRMYPDRIEPIDIVMNNSITDYKHFRDTLIHEMLHAYCDLNLSEDDFKKASSLYPYKSIGWKKYLGLTDETAHSGKWLEIANDINKKNKNIHVIRMGNHDYEGRDSSGGLKKELMDSVKQGHLLVRDDGYKKFLIFANPELYKAIKENMYQESWPYGGQWTEYEFNPVILSNMITKTSDSITRGYKYKVLNVLKKFGAVLDSKILGGKKYYTKKPKKLIPW